MYLNIQALLNAIKKQNSIKLLSNTLTNPNSPLAKIQAIISYIPKKISQIWQKLHANQKIYALALLLAIYYLDEITQENEVFILLIGSFALIAMLRELWTIFVAIWDSMLGKSMVLILYAVIANFTLALAGQKVNAIVGVEPTKLIYTQGLTTLLLLPFWIILITLLALTFLFIAQQFRHLAVGTIHLLRLHRFETNHTQHYRGIFLLIKMALLPLVLVTMGIALNKYARFVDIEDMSFDISKLENQSNTGKSFKQTLNDTNLINKNIDQAQPEELANNESVIDKASKDDTPASSETDGSDRITLFSSAIPKPRERITSFERLIAGFVYNYETYPYSRCVISPESRAIPISENDILTVVKDDSSLGYKFSVKLCQLRQD